MRTPLPVLRAARAVALLALLCAVAAAIAPTPMTVRIGDDWQAVVDANPAGTIYLIESGTHWRQRVHPKDGDILIGEPGAVMHGGRVLTDFGREGALWTAAATSQWGSGGAPHGSCDSFLTNGDGSRYTGCTYNEMLFLDRQPLLRVITKGEVGTGEWFFDIPTGRIYFADDPTGRTVEISETPEAFGGTASNVTVENLTIEMYANRAQAGAIEGTSAPNWIVRNVTSQYNHGIGIRNGAGWLIEGGRFLRNGQMGMGGSRGHGTRIIGNEIAHNNTARFSSGWEAGGTKFARTNGLLLQHNWVHHNEGPGFWADIDNINVTIDGNLVEHNRNEGIFYEISCEAEILNNVARNNGTGGAAWHYKAQILISASYGVEVHHNYVEVPDNGTSNAINLIQQDRTLNADNCAPRMYTVDNLVHSNSVYFVGESGRVGGGSDYADEIFYAGGNDFRNNAYCTPTPTSRRLHWQTTVDFVGWQAKGFDLDGVGYGHAAPECAQMRAELGLPGRRTVR